MATFTFQQMVLKKLGEKLAKESGVDPVMAKEALDVLDSKLEYAENKRLYLTELVRRGIKIPKTTEQVMEEEEKVADWVLEQLPESLRPYVEDWRKEIRRLKEELAKPKVKVKEERVRVEERAPRAPPPPLEFVCPRCGRPLTPVTAISYAEDGQMKIVQVPGRELIWMCSAGKEKQLESEELTIMRAQETYADAARRLEIRRRETAETPKEKRIYAGITTEALKREVDRSQRDLNALMKEYSEFVEKARKECPFFGLYFRVKGGKMVGPVPQSEVLRAIQPPRPRAPPAGEFPPSPFRPRRRTPAELYDESLKVEATKEFHEYVEKEVGMPWASYRASDGWTKDSLRRAFAAKLLEGK